MQNPKQAPLNNGAILDQFIWRQTSQSIDIFVMVVAPCSKKQMKVTIRPNNLSVVVSGVVLVSGELQYEIDQDQSIWLIEDGKIQGYEGRYIHVILEKKKGNFTKWWSTPIKGYRQIDTDLIVPEPNYENSTNLFLPTIDYLKTDMSLKNKLMDSQSQAQKEQKLKAFMLAHPELDFSKCKF